MKKWLVIVVLILSACVKGQRDGNIVLDLHYIPATAHYYPLRTLTLPHGADKIAITITGADFSSIIKEISVAANPSGTTVNGIPAGINRSVNVDIKDAGGMVIARGKTTGIRINAGDINNVNILITQTGVFTRLNSKVIPRAFAVSTPLSDGTYMIMGGIVDKQLSCGQGCIQFAATSQTEIYDSNTGIFRQGPSMTEPRVFFTANMLSDGTVVITGGADSVDISCNAASCSVVIPESGIKASMESYDPRSKSFYKSRTLSIPRAGHTANLVAKDTLIIAGGVTTNGSADSAELINIKENNSTDYKMTTIRTFHAAIAYSADISGGDVLLFGGNTSGANIELFNPSTGFRPSSILQNVYTAMFPAAIFIPQSALIVLNGGFDPSWEAQSRMLIIDPLYDRVIASENMSMPRAFFSDVLPEDGNILIAGGVTTSAFTATDTAEVFSPVSKSFAAKTPVLSVPRAGYAVQRLTNGSALFVSGFSTINPLTGAIRFIDTAEIYNP